MSKGELMWGKLSCGELSLGRDVCNSPRQSLYVNSLLGLSIKPKSEIESRSTLEKRKFLISASVFDKISIVSSQTRETF